MMSSQLDSQVSVDAAPITPSSAYPTRTIQDSVNFFSRDVSVDALPGRRRPVTNERTALEMVQERDARRSEYPGVPSRPAPSKSLDPRSTWVESSSSERSTELDQVQSELNEKMDDLSISVSMSSSSGSFSDSSCSSMPSVNWEADIARYREKMPADVKTDYIDALILYAEEDREVAEKFCKHLIKDIQIKTNGPVKALLYDCEELQSLSGSKIGHLDKIVERSTYIFMYLTKYFVKDKWMEFSSESCLMTAIYDEMKRWCVVPVYTEKRSPSYKIPMGLNSLKGINYYNNDEFYRRGVARLIGDKVYVRVQANENLKIIQKKWIEQQKRKDIIMRENQRRVEQMEKHTTDRMNIWLNEEADRLIRAGVIPGLPHSMSESRLSEELPSLKHSLSTQSLKPIPPQNPAVDEYFRVLLQQCRSGIPTHYSPEQMEVIQRSYGGSGPMSPTQQTAGVGGQMMAPQYQPSEVLYQRMNSPPTAAGQLQRTSSQTSTVYGDLGSSSFPLKMDQRVIDVQIPKELSEKIKNYDEEKKQKYVRMYYDQQPEPSSQQQQSHGAMIPHQNAPMLQQQSHQNAQQHQQFMNQQHQQFMNQQNMQFMNQQNSQFMPQQNAQIMPQHNGQFMPQQNGQFMNHQNPQFMNQQNPQLMYQQNPQFIHQQNPQQNMQYLPQQNQQFMQTQTPQMPQTSVQQSSATSGAQQLTGQKEPVRSGDATGPRSEFDDVFNGVPDLKDSLKGSTEGSLSPESSLPLELSASVHLSAGVGDPSAGCQGDIAGVPNLSMLGAESYMAPDSHGSMSSMGESGSHTSSEGYSTSHQGSTTGHSVDGPKSSLPPQGNIPMGLFSMTSVEEDGASLPQGGTASSVRSEVTRHAGMAPGGTASSVRSEVTRHAGMAPGGTASSVRSEVTGHAGRSENQKDGDIKENQEVASQRPDGEKDSKTKKRKGKGDKIVHYTINVYNANTVQVGDGNITQKLGLPGSADMVDDSDDDDDNDDEENVEESVLRDDVEKQVDEKVTKFVRRSRSSSPSKSGACHDESKLPLLKGEGGECAESRGEMREQADASGGSYNMDAAMSSVGGHLLTQIQSEIHHTLPKAMPDGKPGAPSKDVVTTNTLPSGLEKILRKEGDTNFQQADKEEKASSMHKIVLPEKSTVVGSRPIHTVMPLQKRESKEKDDTDPKTIVPTQQTGVKQLAGSVDPDQTNAKTVIYSGDCGAQDGDRLVQPQPGVTRPNIGMTAPYAHTNYRDENKYFYMNAFGPEDSEGNGAGDEFDSLEATCSGNGTRYEAVPLGNDPLSREHNPDSQGFQPQTSGFTPHSTKDLDEDDLEEDGFERISTPSASNPYKNRPGKSSKECIIS